MADEETQSWKDRCDRYFSSIVDSNDEKDQETRKGKDRDKNWKDFSDELDDRLETKSMLSHIKFLVSMVDIHGFKLAGSSSGWICFSFWIILSMIFSGALGFVVYLAINSYIMHSPEFLSIFREYSGRSPFGTNPAVSICNLNILKKSKLPGTRFSNLLNLSSALEYSNLSVLSTKPSKALFKESKIWEVVKDEISTETSELFALQLDKDFLPFQWMRSEDDFVGGFKGSLTYNMDIVREAIQPSRKELLEFGHSHRLLVHCLVDGKMCNKSNFYQFQDNKMGNCIKITSEDRIEKLKFVVDVEVDEYIPGLNPTVGVTLCVHDNITSQDTCSLFTVSPGSSAHLHAYKTTTFQYEGRNCKKGPHYSRNVCIQSCKDSFLTRYCLCSKSIDALKTDRCKPNVKINFICQQTVEKLLEMGKLKCDCPPNCRWTMFEVAMSTVPWPDPSYENVLLLTMKNIGLEMNRTQIRKSLSLINVNFESVIHEEKKQSSMSLLTVLSNVGGLSALVSGISILSILELIWILINVCCHGCKTVSKSRQKKRSVQQLAESEITSVTWTAYKERRRQEVVGKENNITFTSHALRQSFKSPFLLPITEENKPPSNSDFNELYPRPWERTGHQRLYKTVVNSKSERGAEFPMFNSLDETERPSYLVQNSFHKNDKSLNRGHYFDRRTRHYQQSSRLITPGDAVQIYGSSAAKYYCSEPMLL